MRVYYLTPPMIMFGLMLPFFLFFSFSLKRNIAADVGLARLLALTTFFTASSAGPVIIPLERRTRTYDRLLAALTLSSLAFAAFGLVFASIPTQSVGNIMMPSTLIRWPLLFISGIFVPLAEMASWARSLAYLSPLTYAQDLFNHAVLGVGYVNQWLDLALLPLLFVLFLLPAAWLHHRSRVLGY